MASDLDSLYLSLIWRPAERTSAICASHHSPRSSSTVVHGQSLQLLKLYEEAVRCLCGVEVYPSARGIPSTKRLRSAVAA
jgi:hypothetical protein